MKLILSSKAKADALRAKVAKHRPGRFFDVYPVLHRHTGEVMGWQTVEVKRVGWWGSFQQATVSLEATLPPEPKIVAAPVALVTITLPFFEETKSYIGATIDGKPAWFGRSTLVGLVIGGGQVTLTLPRKALVKRGLEKLAA